LRLFKWGVSEELVPAEVLQALRSVQGLQKGRCDARESAPVLPVDDADVEAVIPHLLPPVAGLVRFQRLTGCRPGEACRLRPCDLDTGGAVWLYRVPHHKTAHHGKARVIAVGPRAQDVLRPFLRHRCPLCNAEGLPQEIGWQTATCGPCHDRHEEAGGGPLPAFSSPVLPDETFVFSPKKAMAALRVKQRASRKTPVQPSQQNRKKARPKRQHGDHYKTTAYGQAVRKACLKAGVSPWGVNRLRHTYATQARQAFGLEAARVALGHEDADLTAGVYAERDMALAMKVAGEIG
jgi:integrase